jgi:hypothetical protein
VEIDSFADNGPLVDSCLLSVLGLGVNLKCRTNFLAIHWDGKMELDWNILLFAERDGRLETCIVAREELLKLAIWTRWG